LVGKEIIVKISDAEILNHQMLDKNVFYYFLEDMMKNAKVKQLLIALQIDG